MRSILKHLMEIIMNNLAVIGLGSISKRHRANLRKLYPEAKIFAVSASGRQPGEFVENADECLLSVDELMLHNIDMAIVASPATYHAEHAIPLLRAGIPLLIEKPLAACEEDAELIAKAANDTKTPIAVGYCLRYLSSCQKLVEILEENIIGDIYNVFVEIGQYLPDWRFGRNYRDTVSASKKLGGGALLELSHELDYVQWLFGPLQPHSAILRASKELGLEVEDSADILAVNQKGTVFSVHLDFLQRKPQRFCRIIGCKGSVEWNLLANQIKIITCDHERVVFDESDLDRNQMYLNMLEDFSRKVSGLKNQCITVREAKQTVSLIEEIKKIALEG